MVSAERTGEVVLVFLLLLSLRIFTTKMTLYPEVLKPWPPTLVKEMMVPSRYLLAWLRFSKLH